MPVTDRTKLTALVPNLQNNQQADPNVLREAVISLFDTVDTNFTDSGTSVSGHVASVTAHPAQNITYTGTATGTNVKAALDSLKSDVSTAPSDAAIAARANSAQPFVVEVRTSDPVSPVVGRIWFRSDL